MTGIPYGRDKKRADASVAADMNMNETCMVQILSIKRLLELVLVHAKPEEISTPHSISECALTPVRKALRRCHRHLARIASVRAF